MNQTFLCDVVRMKRWRIPIKHIANILFQFFFIVVVIMITFQVFFIFLLLLSVCCCCCDIKLLLLIRIHIYTHWQTHWQNKSRVSSIEEFFSSDRHTLTITSIRNEKKELINCDSDRKSYKIQSILWKRIIQKKNNNNN